MSTLPPPRPLPFLPRTCRDITRLVIESHDRPTRWTERLALAFHLRICKACPTFVRQLTLMQTATGQWSRYGGAAPASGESTTDSDSDSTSDNR